MRSSLREAASIPRSRAIVRVPKVSTTEVIRLSKRSRDELIAEFIAAVRASQTATELLDHATAEYLDIDGTAFRCLDIIDQEGPMTAGRLAERARLSPAATTALLDRLESKGYARR